MAWTLAGRYRLTSLVARGPTGELWRAVDLGTDRPVAVKLLYPHLAGDPRVVDRLRQARRVLTGLWHPGIARLIDVLVADRTVALVADFIPGTDLARALASSGRLAPARAVGIAVAMAEALHAAHLAGVTHGDVKPANVLLPDEPAGVAARLTDFSVATVVRVGRPPDQPGGSPYNAPWVIDGAVATPASDVHALGIVLLEMLAGTTTPDRQTTDRVDPRLLAVVDWCAIGDRAARPSAESVAQELRTIAPGRTPATTPDRRTRSRPDAPSRPDAHSRPGVAPARPGAGPSRRRRVRRLALAGVAAVVVAAAAVATVTVLASREPAPPLATADTTGSPLGASPPALPATATTNDPAGGSEFIRYWFAVLTYATRTGDTAALVEATSLQCPDCQAAIEAIEASYTGGGAIRGGAYVVRNVTTTDLWSPDRQVFDATVDRSPRTEVDTAGATRTTLPALSFSNCVLVLEWVEQRWLVREVVTSGCVG